MQVKRFVAATMREALNMVREDLGPDAVILSNKRVPEGVEILTALEADTLVGVQTSAAEISEKSAAPVTSSIPPRPSTQHPAPSKLERELDRMHRNARQRATSLVASLEKKASGQVSAAEYYSSAASLDAALPESKPVSPMITPKQAAANAFQQVLQSNNTEVDSETASALADDVATFTSTTSKSADSSSGENANDEELAQMRAELQAFRGLLEHQFSSQAWDQLNQKNPISANLWRRLKRMGISTSVVKQLLGKLPSQLDEKQSWQAIMRQLVKAMPIVNDDVVANGGVFALVGPTGAGKTTTIGKLAARYVLKNGAEKVALVTTDTARIAAYEQIRTFGRILNVPVSIVDKSHSLKSVLHSLRHKDLVLVDTSGLNRHDPRLQEQMKTLNNLGLRMKTVLVLPATSQQPVLKAAYHTYKTDNLFACVVTKLDEALSAGEVLSLSVEKKLPIVYSTHGQDVPDDLTVANSQQLLNQAIELARRVQIDEAAMAEEFAPR